MQENQNFKLLRFCYNNTDKVYPISEDKIPYMDLTYCISGKMRYVYEGKEYVLNGGDAILFPQGSFRTRKESTGQTIYCSFNIVCEDFEPEVKGYIPEGIRADTLMVIDSVQKCFNSFSEKKSEKCISLFLYLYYQLTETAENNENPHIKNIRKYIEKHYKESITLEDIASAVHLTPQYCCTLFSKYMGQTLFDFIATQRIEQAKGLLITTNHSLGEISEECGFCDYNYFLRIFKKITGMNARNYRKLNKNM